MADIYQAKWMHKLFMGAENAHGEFTPTGEMEGKKVKGSSITIRKSVTHELWLNHLNGRPPSLGIVPINESSDCFWGVIDIDDYELDFVELLNAIKGTPFVCCKSKSGGAWLFVFTNQAIPAKYMREYLVAMAAKFGYGNSEVFPKQTKVFTERGDVGNWLNMPYFGPTRFGIMLDTTRNGAGPIKELTLTEFIDYVQDKMVNSRFFSKINEFNYDDSPITDGPPCLQVMSLSGFPQGTRDTALFNIGIYLKRLNPEEWPVLLKQFNTRLMKPPLGDKEVATVQRSLGQKEYRYQCSSEPLCSFCNASLCRTRKFGISSANSLPIINSITKVVGDISIWFLDVEGGRLELATEEFHDFRKFSIKCMNSLNILPSPMKLDNWTTWIQAQMEKAIEIRDESMFSYTDLHANLTSFIVARLCEERDDIYNNRVWYNKAENMVYFKMEAFLSYLRFRKINLAKGIVIMFFREKGGRFGVGKTKDRKSYRFMTCPITLEQEQMIGYKEKKGDVL